MDFCLLKGLWLLVTTLREEFNGTGSALVGAECSDHTIPTHSLMRSFSNTPTGKSSLVQGGTLACKIYGDFPGQLNIKTPPSIPALALSLGWAISL